MQRRAGFDQQGFVVEEAVLSPSDVEDLAREFCVLVRARMARERAVPPSPTGDLVVDLGRSLAALQRATDGAGNWLAAQSDRVPMVHRVAADPVLLALARGLLAETLGLEGRRTLLVLAPGADEPEGWDDDPEPSGPSLRALIPLQQIGPELGGVRLSPGLHRAGSSLGTRLGLGGGRSFALQPSLVPALRAEQRLDLAAGDALFHDARLPLAFERNRSTRPLFYLSFRYTDLASTAVRGLADAHASARPAARPADRRANADVSADDGQDRQWSSAAGGASSSPR